MSLQDFVKRAERSLKDSINRSYRCIDMLHYELSFLNDQLLRYSNKHSGRTLTARERQDEIADIRERIPEAYKDINYYKECINAERKELQRIYDTYGYSSTKYYKEEKYDIYDERQANFGHHTNDYNDDNDYEESDNELENEIEEEEPPQDYKYNPETGMFE